MTAFDPTESVLEVSGLTVDFRVGASLFRAVDGADLEIGSGETVGLVGESGAGKSTLALAAAGLLPSNAFGNGEVRLAGVSVLHAKEGHLRSLRQNYVGFVFQSAATALDPTRTVRALLSDVGISAKEAPDLLHRVALPATPSILRSYPHELSGGMAQRVAIALAIARSPRLVVADEPTASLDSSIRQQILMLLFGLRRTLGVSILFLSHDITSVGRFCDRVAVMYAGRVVEEGPSRTVLSSPRHPYTAALLAAAPGKEQAGEGLEPIPGTPPLLRGPSQRCAFAQRCRFAIEACVDHRPTVQSIGDQRVICVRADEIELAVPTPAA